MPHPNEKLQAQHIAEQLLQGSAPGSMATWQAAPPHLGQPGPDQHPYGPHIGVGYVRGDGSVYGTVQPPG